ncbi:glycoprotein-N-acetylgalactosamine 3-beta-galactosyltransferase 1-like protein, partial [Dinothrombium tinctorium]
SVSAPHSNSIHYSLLNQFTAAGLYYLAELVEEYTVIAAKVIRITIICSLIIYLLLFIFEEFPTLLILMGAIAHFVHLLVLRTFPYFNLSSIPFLSAIALLVFNHYLAFSYFSTVYYPFTQVLGYFTTCLWLVPFAFFVSLSANDNVLPTVAETRPLLSGQYQSIQHQNYDKWLRESGFKRIHLAEEDVSFGSVNVTLEYLLLREKVNVLCVVFTKNKLRAKAVKHTWGAHCNDIVFYGPYSDRNIPVIKRIPSITQSSFCRQLLELWQKYSKTFDWMFITYETTYAIIENLRFFVSTLNHSQYHFLGRCVKTFAKPALNAPESGIVLSKAVVNYLVNKFNSTQACEKSHLKTGGVSRKFDEFLAYVLAENGILPKDTIDSKGKARFLAFSLERHIHPGLISIFNSYWRNNVFKIREGINCCSDYAITLPSVTVAQMYLYEYLLYHLSVFSNSDKGLGNQKPKYLFKKAIDMSFDNLIETGTSIVKLY